VNRIAIIGTGFVADLYMRSIRTFPDFEISKVYDIDASRLRAFCLYWKVTPADSLEDLLADTVDLILNLTNPSAHFAVSRACLLAGKHVYSEKPLATVMSQAQELCELADSKSLLLSSAPCSVLGETAQTLWLALRRNVVGRPRLIYAELDDDFVTQAPYRSWRSESGAPWPYRDEFQTGCTLEHAGYYLSWLMAMFGSVEEVVAGAANLIENKLEDQRQTAPDFSCAILYFKSGVVARLTCSIVAPHNHQLRVVGDGGILEVDQSWDNHTAVRIRRRFILRRRLINIPITRRVKIKGTTHPKVERWGAARMNFALGPAETLAAIREGRPSRLSSGFALHLNEVTLAIQSGGAQRMQTICPKVDPMPWAK
jgi:predicted dehydrogenase